ncbi:hypothetical protein HL42_4388 [Trichophyton rubrum]|nr:hypothetical protein HL42_4388 [Trichophyton rubrum]
MSHYYSVVVDGGKERSPPRYRANQTRVIQRPFVKLFPLASIPSASRSRLFFPEQRLEESLSFFTCLRIINSPRAYLGGTSGAYLIQPTLKPRIKPGYNRRQIKLSDPPRHLSEKEQNGVCGCGISGNTALAELKFDSNLIRLPVTGEAHINTIGIVISTAPP